MIEVKLEGFKLEGRRQTSSVTMAVDEDMVSVERSLRAKFDRGGYDGDRSSALETQTPPPMQTEDSPTVNVQLCVVCQGEGLVRVQYNARVMERSCETCDGEGTFVYKNGVQVPSSSPRGTCDAEEAKLIADINRLKGMKEKYEREMGELKAMLSGGDGDLDDERRTLLEGVLDGVTKMLDRVSNALTKTNVKKERLSVTRRRKR